MFILNLLSSPILWIALIAPYFIGKAFDRVRDKISGKLLNIYENDLTDKTKENNVNTTPNSSSDEKKKLVELRNHLKDGSWSVVFSDVILQIYAFLVPLIYLPIYFLSTFWDKISKFTTLSFKNDFIFFFCCLFTIGSVLLMFYLIQGEYLTLESLNKYKEKLEPKTPKNLFDKFKKKFPPLNTKISYLRLYTLIYALLIFLEGNDINSL